jgi:ABC-2 type transport system ATP-binding protein
LTHQPGKQDNCQAAVRTARMPRAMLEIVAADPHRARDAVRALPGVLLVGIAVHVHVDRAERRPQIAAALAAAGVAVSAIEEVAPSIEDLFVALIE